MKDNPSISIYVNKIWNSITFKFKRAYYLDLLTPEAIKLLGTTKSKITEDKNGESEPNLEITEVVLLRCKIVNSDYQKDLRNVCTFVPNKLFGQLSDITLEGFIYFGIHLT